MHCRGFIGNHDADALSVPELVGLEEDATLRVSRTHPYWRRPYTGTIRLKTGEIAEDIVQYLAQSEQTPASMGLSVELDPEAGTVTHAEGFLMTLLPNWDEAEVAVVEANIASFTRMEPSSLPRPEAICEHLMRELRGEFQMEEKPRWRCSCQTDPKRLLTAIMMLGKLEVLKILREKEDVQATCEWCNSRMTVTVDQIREHMKTDDGEKEVETRSASPRQMKLMEEEIQTMPEPGTAKWD